MPWFDIFSDYACKLFNAIAREWIIYKHADDDWLFITSFSTKHRITIICYCTDVRTIRKEFGYEYRKKKKKKPSYTAHPDNKNDLTSREQKMSVFIVEKRQQHVVDDAEKNVYWIWQ